MTSFAVPGDDATTSLSSSTNCNGRQVYNDVVDAVDIDLTWYAINYTYGWNGASILWSNGVIDSAYALADGWQFNYSYTGVGDYGYYRYPYGQGNFEFSPCGTTPRWEHFHRVHMTVSAQGSCSATFSYTGTLVPGGYVCGHTWRDRPRPSGIC